MSRPAAAAPTGSNKASLEFLLSPSDGPPDASAAAAATSHAPPSTDAAAVSVMTKAESPAPDGVVPARTPAPVEKLVMPPPKEVTFRRLRLGEQESEVLLSEQPLYEENILKDIIRILAAVPEQRQELIPFFGKAYQEPRTTMWCADDAELNYKYQTIVRPIYGFNDLLLQLKTAVEQVTGLRYNSCLTNFYRHGKDHMGYHSDDEKELGPDPTIASVSFGATRRFTFKSKKTHKITSVDLASGSLLVMKGKTQEQFWHSLPAMNKLGQNLRINITFRWVHRDLAAFLTPTDYSHLPLVKTGETGYKHGVGDGPWEVGQEWHDRIDIWRFGVHALQCGAIAAENVRPKTDANAKVAESILLAGAYPEDEDHGLWFLFTGNGGVGDNGVHIEDQQYTRSNRALLKSLVFDEPVRVIRSFKMRSRWAPPAGFFRYTGLYRIVATWTETHRSGHDLVRFLLTFCEDLMPVPECLKDGREPIPTPAEFFNLRRAAAAQRRFPECRDVAYRDDQRRLPSWVDLVLSKSRTTASPKEPPAAKPSTPPQPKAKSAKAAGTEPPPPPAAAAAAKVEPNAPPAKRRKLLQATTAAESLPLPSSAGGAAALALLEKDGGAKRAALPKLADIPVMEGRTVICGDKEGAVRAGEVVCGCGCGETMSLCMFEKHGGRAAARQPYKSVRDKVSGQAIEAFRQEVVRALSSADVPASSSSSAAAASPAADAVGAGPVTDLTAHTSPSATPCVGTLVVAGPLVDAAATNAPPADPPAAFTCPHCDRSFDCEKGLKIHCTRTHPLLPPPLRQPQQQGPQPADLAPEVKANGQAVAATELTARPALRQTAFADSPTPQLSVGVQPAAPEASLVAGLIPQFLVELFARARDAIATAGRASADKDDRLASSMEQPPLEQPPLIPSAQQPSAERDVSRAFHRRRKARAAQTDGTGGGQPPLADSEDRQLSSASPSSSVGGRHAVVDSAAALCSTGGTTAPPRSLSSASAAATAEDEFVDVDSLDDDDEQQQQRSLLDEGQAQLNEQKRAAATATAAAQPKVSGRRRPQSNPDLTDASTQPPARPKRARSSNV